MVGSALVVGLLLLVAAKGPQEPESTLSFPAEAEAVMVDVVVTSRDGLPVLGLDRRDFTAVEDGQPREIVVFQAVHRPAPGDPGGEGVATFEPEPRSTSNRPDRAAAAAVFAIVFDDLHLDTAEAVRGREAVSEFLEHQVADGDRVALVGTADGICRSVRIPDGLEALKVALAGFHGRRVGADAPEAITEYEAMRIVQESDPIITGRVLRRLRSDAPTAGEARAPGRPPGEASGRVDTTLVVALAERVYALAAMRSQQTLAVVDSVVSSLAGARGRKSVFLVSGGLLQDPHLTAVRRVVTSAFRANATIHFLDARGLVAAPSQLQADVGRPLAVEDLLAGAGITESRERSEGAEALAASTGGLALKNRNDLAAALARIGSESRSYYLIGYAPTGRAADGRFRSVSVRVAREGVKVRHRPGYYAPGRDEKPPRPETPEAAFRRALAAPLDLPDVPLRTLAQAFGEAAPGRAAILLTTDVDIRGLMFSEEGGIAHDTLDTLVLVSRRDTDEMIRVDRQFEMSLRPETRARFARTWFPITHEVPLVPGPYRARIVVRDRNGGSTGSLTHDFEVPEASGLRVSSIVLSDRLQEDSPSAARAPELTARRRFTPSGVLHCRFEVYGAARESPGHRVRVTAGFSIRRVDGEILAALPETPLRPGPDGSLVRALGVSLREAPLGIYEAIAVVTDLVAGRSALAREPFVLEEAGSP